MYRISYNKQYLDRKDFKEVERSLRENLITTGPYVNKFENKLKDYLNVNEVVTCSSGTSALYIALKGINLKPNDIVITPAINFIASVNMLKILRAKIYLCDVDSETGQMTPDKLETCIKKNKIKKIKAVISMYLGGNPDNAVNFYKLKKKYKFVLIEDSCHALGSEYYFKNKKIKIGSCQHSDISTFSLHPVKSITSGEGGFLTTNSKVLAKKFKLIRSHGILRSEKNYWKYDVISASFNFRMSDINAALAYSQLDKLDKFVKKRNYLADIYHKSLLKHHNKIKIIKSSKNTFSAYHLLIIIFNFKKLSVDKDKLIKLLNKKKIYPQYHYIPIYKFSAYKYLKKGNSFISSEKYYKTALSMPIYYSLGIKNLMKVIRAIISIVNKYEK
mgnify:CR=1 FL=1